MHPVDHRLVVPAARQRRVVPCTACVQEDLGPQASSSSDSRSLVTSPEQPSSALTAVLALNVVTILWGTQHAIIKGVVDATSSPDLVNAVRFDLAALLALPFAPRPGGEPEADRSARATWAAGADLGLWMFVGYALQAVGLQLTSASRSAFLLYLNVKLVPVIAFFVYGRAVAARTWLSAAVAVAGTCLLTYDGTPPNVGDAWSLAAALASAIFILRLEAASRDEALAGPAQLNAATLASTALLSTLWAFASTLITGDNFAADVIAPLRDQAAPLLYLSLVTTVFANWLQTVGQKDVSAPDAAIIYALDPVYGAGFSFLLLGETLGPQGLAGAGLVLLAVLLSRTAPEPEAAAGAGAGGGEAEMMVPLKAEESEAPVG